MIDKICIFLYTLEVEMKKTRAFFTLFFCLFQVSRLFASYDSFLDTCLKIAQSRDKKLAVADEQINLSKTRVVRSGRSFFPLVTLEDKYTRGKTFVGGTDTSATQAYESESQGLQASLPIYQGGRLKSAYNYDLLLEESSKYNYTKIREDLFYNIKLAYYEYQTLKMEFTALQKAFAEIDALANKVKIEYNAKAISELDLIEAENFRDKLENLFLASKANYVLADRKLSFLVNVQTLDEIPAVMPEGLIENVPEVTFTIKECLDFVPLNSVDLKLNQLQILMSEEKFKMNRSKIVPKIDLAGFYGKSGEAYVSEPLDLATSWSVMGRLSWTLWGNSFEATNSQEKTNPNELVEPTALIDNDTIDIKLGIADDINYFVESKESDIGRQQAESEYNDILNKLNITLEQTYNEYTDSLRNERTLKNEITLMQRKLELLKKKNELYEVPTVQLMEESWKYAETIAAYGKALYANYSSVAEMERIVLISLR